MLLGNKPHLRNLSDFSIIINNYVIYTCEQIKCLGLIIDSDLTWDTQIANLCKISFYRIYSICKFRKFLAFSELKTIAESGVLSVINYMSSLWG